jgi:hypothetical protein
LSHKTTWSELFADSPRLKEISSVFKEIDRPEATIDQIYAKMSAVMPRLNDKRNALPPLVKAALVGREPVRDLCHPSMG